ncbi:hypothetical protein EVAR_75546_1 [Eumeta japonica]|uniref:Uncharacterized protein n=1 Tax=Eumeta variegata TaxID=151549 RepID=A0A4C1UKJ7_EUMVA|nr:hypothetical protein EVAR_75546_1 [Eumeta japonica]
MGVAVRTVENGEKKLFERVRFSEGMLSEIRFLYRRFSLMAKDKVLIYAEGAQQSTRMLPYVNLPLPAEGAMLEKAIRIEREPEERLRLILAGAQRTFLGQRLGSTLAAPSSDCGLLLPVAPRTEGQAPTTHSDCWRKFSSTPTFVVSTRIRREETMRYRME